MKATPVSFDPLAHFASLRPYADNEVRDVLKRLSQDEAFQKLLAQYYLPAWQRKFPVLSNQIARFLIKRRSRHVHSIDDFQIHIAHFMELMLERTVTEFSYEGLEHLDIQKPYLYISNHRDISLDPAFLNLALHRSQRATVRIAIGDNLVSMPFASDLMRLNKSFIVPRSSAGKREMLKAFQLLAEYIHYSLEQDHQSVWLAQRQGRAKDGIDRTDPALLKMLLMPLRHLSSDEILPTLLNRLSIVPVSISYEYDPCDLIKARELTMQANQAVYQKSAHEDLHSIALGITGFKGKVHLTFGKPITQLAHNDIDTLAKALDTQIISNYRLFASHYLALEALKEYPELWQAIDIETDDRKQFLARLASVPEALRYWWLRQYANPVIERAKVLNTI